MNNRSEYPGLARLSAAIFTFVLMSMMLILPAAAVGQLGGPPAPAAGAKALGKPAVISSVASYGQLRGALPLPRRAGR